MSIAITELQPGIVLKLDPKILLDNGSTTPLLRDEKHRCQNIHYFLCLYIYNGCSCWTPLYSNFGKNRYKIPKNKKFGDFGFMGKLSYFHIHQLWQCKSTAIVPAVAEEPIKPGCYNAVINLDIIKSIPLKDAQDICVKCKG